MTDAGALQGLGLRVAFRRLADRYSHVVLAQDGTAEIALVESLEGTAEDDWPASPALQQLHFERRPDGSRWALLVGRAGTSHWSLSIEAAPQSPRVTFDVACRLRCSPARLGSEYRLPGGVRLLTSVPASRGAPGIALAAGARLQVEPIEDALARIQAVRQENMDFASEAGGAIRIEAPAAEAPWPKTVRWKYSITAGRPAAATEPGG